MPVEVPGSPPQVGWLGLPNGQFAHDPSAAAAMSRYGYVAWDAGVGKWIPSSPRGISPDGSLYVPVDTADIEVVDARSGTVLHEVPQGDYNVVIGYTNQGIYLVHEGKDGIPGLWDINPATGTVKQVQSNTLGVAWTLVDDTAAWGRLPLPSGAAIIERLDLATGAIKAVYQSPGNYDHAIVGFVGAGVLVISAAGPSRVVSAVVVNPDGSTESIEIPAQLQDKPFWQGNPLQDGATIYFSGLGVGVAAYDPKHGLQVLADTPQDLFLLGLCRAQQA